MNKLQSQEIRLLKKLAAGKTLSRKCFEEEIETLKKFQRHDLIVLKNKKIQLTKQGISFLKRKITEHDTPYQAQHKILEKEKLDHEDVLINQSESPLKHLYKRKGKNGERLISKAQLLAGERLRQDFEKAQLATISSVKLTPKVDQSSGSLSLFYAQEKTIEARRRLHEALEEVGKDMDSLLLDIFCFLKGLESVEKERNWPLRSGKVVLSLALSRLAEHYGLQEEARGKNRAALSSWHY